MTAVTVSPPVAAPGGDPRPRITQTRVLRSEWTKLRSLRSTLFTLLAALTFVVGLGILISWGRASHWASESPADRLGFDATNTSLSGIYLAQLAIGVLGVLAFSGEYATGMIRATLGAVPKRLPVLWAKAGVFAAVTFVLMTVAAVAAFLGGQAMLSSQHIQTSLSHPGVVTAVLGAGLYLTVVGLLGVALGALLRSTAGGIATLFGILLVLPLIVHFLPSAWSRHIDKYLPSNAGQSIINVVHDPSAMHPWNGFFLFLGYAVIAIAASAFVLVRRDA
jgi:ABC-type transport system involved in multi-copper enzyme maturation permease subunit